MELRMKSQSHHKHYYTYLVLKPLWQNSIFCYNFKKVFVEKMLGKNVRPKSPAFDTGLNKLLSHNWNLRLSIISRYS